MSGQDRTASKPLYIMIGGFLGAGKTTAILRLAEHLKKRDRRVGLITNDQSVDLVDTARVRSAGFPVEEITGGCFCCKFDSLVDASAELFRKTEPDVLVAEPVGSCTDLKATVSYPLRKLHGDRCRVAPLSVMVDPRRCARVLGIDSTGGHFSDKVVYIYRKQLEEAEILVVNKIDTVDRGARQKLVSALKLSFPHARVLEVSCATGEGLNAWFDLITAGELGGRKPMEVDYDVYADGEAMLGWLNSSIQLSAAAKFDGNALLNRLATDLRDRLASKGIEIAHLKMTLIPPDGPDTGSISLTRTDDRPEATRLLKAQLDRGTLLINLRAETDPEILKSEVNRAVRAIGNIRGDISELASFRPGRPTPTHRMAAATA